MHDQSAGESEASGHRLTQLLDAVSCGDETAREQLWDAVYQELRRVAVSFTAREGALCELQPTVLVNEAYLRLFGRDNVRFQNRRHFFGAATQAMRRILVDDARKRGREKRGGGAAPLKLDGDPAATGMDPALILGIEESLQRLERQLPRAAEVVRLRYFAGLSIDQTAELLEIAPRTVDAEWSMARAWLHRELAMAENDAN